MGINWDADFAGLPPIELPDGRKLKTLADCRTTTLNGRQRNAIHCRFAKTALYQAADRGGWFRFIARVAFGKALRDESGVGPAPEAPDTAAAWKAKRARGRRRA